MEFGEDVVIKSSFLSNLVGLYQRTVIVTRTEKARISIGSRVGISGATIYAREAIEIGDDTNIGGNVKILDNDFHPLDEEERRRDIKEKIGVKPVKPSTTISVRFSRSERCKCFARSTVRSSTVVYSLLSAS